MLSSGAQRCASPSCHSEENENDTFHLPQVRIELTNVAISSRRYDGPPTCEIYEIYIFFKQ